MLHVVLYNPEIPQNTGNIGRLCAVTGMRLHLIHPLGFKISDKHLKRSGMDYWHELDIVEHADWEAFEKSDQAPKRLWMFTTKTEKSFWEPKYQDGDGLLFGNEGKGCPSWLHERLGDEYRVNIPHFKAGMRSLNLSTSAGIAAYEVMRQLS